MKYFNLPPSGISFWLSMVILCAWISLLSNATAQSLTFGRGTNGVAIDQYFFATGTAGEPNELNVDQNSIDLIEEYAYVKFEDLFGRLANQIPFGSSIISAQLTLTTKNESVDATQIHRLLQDISSRPSDINSGNTSGFFEETVLDSKIPQNNETAYRFDVTDAVQDWSSGEPNHGLILLPTGRDGTLYYSTEGDLEKSPLLTVLYFVDTFKGLVGYYEFEGNIEDNSGQQNHIHSLTGAVITKDRFGNPESALQLNGSSYGVVPSSESLKVGGSSITLMAWVCPSQYIPFGGGNGNRHTILRKMSQTGNIGGYTLSLYHTDGSINFAARLKNGGSIDETANADGPLLNKWSHVAVTFDGKNIKFFHNGNLVDEVSRIGELEVDNDDLVIGQLSEPHSSENFFGKLDEIRIYNRTLNSIEIKQLFSNVALKSYSGLTIVGDIGANYLIEAADSLDPANNWAPITNITLTTCPFIWVDLESAFLPKRFYRAVPLE